MRMGDLMAQLRAAVAEFGGDAKVQRIQTVGPLPDDGYSRTAPGVIGAAKTALVMRETETGLKLSLVVKDGTPDLHRTEQIKVYSRLKRERKRKELLGNVDDSGT